MNCEKYSRLYTWEAALKACPPNWHLPSDEEWWKMTSYYGKAFSAPKNNTKFRAGKAAYKALKEGGYSGFNGLLGGPGPPHSLSYYGRYWTSTAIDSSSVWVYDFISYNDIPYKYLGRDFFIFEDWRFSCRCVQD